MASQPRQRPLLPIEIILSCHICFKPISEIYRESESDKGFNDGTAGRDVERPVTKLWLTECTHLICGEHLEGGGKYSIDPEALPRCANRGATAGVPFHPAGQQPKAKCPYCVANKDKHDKVLLFGIRGCNEDQHDSAIPKSFFNTPPITLDGRDNGFDALRFQYLSLVHFGTSTFARCQRLQGDHSRAQSRLADITAEIQLLQETVQKLRVKEAQLERCEKELRPWKERESKIKYYLGIFTGVME